MQLLLHDDCLVNFLEKGVFGGIAASLIDCLHHGRRLLLDTHGNPLLLLLHHFVLVVVLGELGPETSEDLILVGLVLEHLHEIFHAGKVVEHCHTVVHDFLLGHAEVLKPGKCVLCTNVEPYEAEREITAIVDKIVQCLAPINQLMVSFLYRL